MVKSIGAIDIFAGAGGLGEGFHQGGFDILSSLDYNHHCCQTLRTRIVFRYLMDINQLSLYSEYVRDKVTIEQLCNKFIKLTDLWEEGVREIQLSEKNVSSECSRITRILNSNGHRALDILIGGPP
ncbi:MAG: HhaI Dna (cytosine-C5-)-methyltransferase, partial [Candidatus Scalindua rubra]